MHIPVVVNWKEQCSFLDLSNGSFLCHFYSSMSKLRTREACLQLFHPLSQSMWSVTSSPLSLWTPHMPPVCHLLSRQDPVYTMSTPQMLTQGQVLCQNSINNDKSFNYYSLRFYYLMILSLFSIESIQCYYLFHHWRWPSTKFVQHQSIIRSDLYILPELVLWLQYSIHCKFP